MLLQLRDFIHEQLVVSTQQLSRAFHVEAQALQPMLDIWVQRGVIRQCHEKTACQSSCFRNDCKTLVFYQFIV